MYGEVVEQKRVQVGSDSATSTYGKDSLAHHGFIQHSIVRQHDGKLHPSGRREWSTDTERLTTFGEPLGDVGIGLCEFVRFRSGGERLKDELRPTEFHIDGSSQRGAREVGMDDGRFVPLKLQTQLVQTRQRIGVGSGGCSIAAACTSTLAETRAETRESTFIVRMRSNVDHVER